MVVDRRARVLWSLFAAIAVVSSLLVMRRPSWDRLSDLHIYYGAVQTVQAGRPLYEYAAENGGPFTYPPFAILVLWPIGLVPEGVVQIIWLVLTCAAVAAIAIAVGRRMLSEPNSQRLATSPDGRCRAAEPHRRGVVAEPDGGRGQLAMAAVACAVMISAPAQSNLRFGQVSIFIVLLALVDAMGLTPARYRGVLVGIAAAIKLTPLLFVVFFLFARRGGDARRAIGAFAVSTALAWVLLPQDSWQFWTEAVLHTSRIGDLASLGNQSLHGMLLRIGVSGSVLPAVWAGLIAIICGIALVRARQIQLEGESARAAVLVGCATVAASPVSWTHHQVWPVLAAMLLIAAKGALRRVAGVALWATMVLSLGVLLSDVSTTPGLQFVLENARALSVLAICVVGFGGVVVVTARARRTLRVVTTAAATLALVALLPLPAGADPTFKAYTLADVHNPRYFFVCHSQTECADMATVGPVNFGITWEKTKVRVNGVVDESVARLEYKSAPGGVPRTIPLVEIYPGQRGFSFRCANLAHGRLVAYDAVGQPIAVGLPP